MPIGRESVGLWTVSNVIDWPESPGRLGQWSDAPVAATAAALARAESAQAVVLVEGISDQMALETLAGRQGRDLAAEGIVIVPIGGAHAVDPLSRPVRSRGSGPEPSPGCVTRPKRPSFGVGWRLRVSVPAQNRIEMERFGFFVCERDLEDELIRASGRVAIEALLDSQGDLGSFQTLRQQPAWRQEGFEAQMRRWLGAGARRKLRYARLLVLALPLDRMPRPLTAVLAATSSPTRPTVGESVPWAKVRDEQPTDSSRGRRGDRPGPGSRSGAGLLPRPTGPRGDLAQHELGQVGLRLPGSNAELVLTTQQGYEVNWLVDSVPQAVAAIVSGGGRVIVEEHPIPVGRLAVVADPFDNRLILLDLSAGIYVTDQEGRVVGIEPH